MVVPESDEIFIDLGEVICEDVHSSPDETFNKI